VREVQPLARLRLNKVVGNGYEHVTLNQRHFPAFADVRVRRALAHAVDRASMVRTLLDEQVSVVNGPIQPLSPAYEPNVTSYPYDTVAANRLLDEAGWRRGSDGVRNRNGKRLAFTLITQSGFAIRENVSQALQQAYRTVGVDMQVQLLDGTSISSVWFKGEFDAMLHWWQMGADPELTLFFARDRTPPAGRNINYVDDAELTALLYESDRTADEGARNALLRTAQRRIAALAPEIPLYNTAKVDAIPATLKGFTGNPTNAGPFWNVHAWEITPR
jgi:peptide/nickel transport system substrate-binding protein